MKIAHILPTAFYKSATESDLPREVEMYLTQEVLSHPEVYGKVRQRKSFKILDNGACELGAPLSPNEIIKAAQIIGANEVVLPDIPQSSYSLCETLGGWEALVAAFERVGEEVPRFMGVAQGASLEEAIICAQQLCSLSFIDTIGIPKWYTKQSSVDGWGRLKITEAIIHTAVALNKDIHWLGSEIGIRELINPLTTKIRSCDTGYYVCLKAYDPQANVYMDRNNSLSIDLSERAHVAPTQVLQGAFEQLDNILKQVK